jgi:hypothetical protein
MRQAILVCPYSIGSILKKSDGIDQAELYAK